MCARRRNGPKAPFSSRNRRDDVSVDAWVRCSISPPQERLSAARRAHSMRPYGLFLILGHMHQQMGWSFPPLKAGAKWEFGEADSILEGNGRNGLCPSQGRLSAARRAHAVRPYGLFPILGHIQQQTGWIFPPLKAGAKWELGEADSTLERKGRNDLCPSQGRLSAARRAHAVRPCTPVLRGSGWSPDRPVLRFAALRFFALAPVHPRCSARLRASA